MSSDKKNLVEAMQSEKKQIYGFYLLNFYGFSMFLVFLLDFANRKLLTGGHRAPAVAVSNLIARDLTWNSRGSFPNSSGLPRAVWNKIQQK